MRHVNENGGGLNATVNLKVLFSNYTLMTVHRLKIEESRANLNTLYANVTFLLQIMDK